jgi:hypothetical protein
MSESNFVDRAKQYFNFLETDFGFTIVNEANSEVRSLTDGDIEFASDVINVLIDSENGYVSLQFYRPKDGPKYYLTPIDIYEYLNTTNEEKELLLSTSPADRLAASELFNEKFLLSQPGWKGSRGTAQNSDNELKNYSEWLRQHTKLILEKDLSWWPGIYEYKINRARADHLRSGKDELRYTRVKDVYGNSKLIKQSVFKDKLEHVEKLKKEFQK